MFCRKKEPEVKIEYARPQFVTEQDQIKDFGFDIEVKKLNEIHEIRTSKPARREGIEFYCTCGLYCQFFADWTLDMLKGLQSTASESKK